MRQRLVRPEFFVDEGLVTVSPLARLLFVALWCIADREGRLEDRPQRIKMQALPCDNCDCDELLNELAGIGVIHRYTSTEGQPLLEVRNFKKFQNPHPKEAASVLPAVPCNATESNGKVCASPSVYGNGNGKNRPSVCTREYVPRCFIGKDEEYVERKVAVKWSKSTESDFAAVISALRETCDPACDGKHSCWRTPFDDALGSARLLRALPDFIRQRRQ